MLGIFRRKLLLIAAGIFASLVVGLLMLPTILGTKWIYQPLVDRLRADDFILSIDGIHLSWFSPLRFERIVVQQTNGTRLVSIAAVRSERSLFGFLIGGRKLGRIDVMNPIVDVKLLADSSNLERLVKAIEGKTKSAGDQAKRDKPRIDVEVLIVGLSANVERAGETEPLVVIPPFDIRAEYLATDGPSRLNIGSTQVLKEVQITPELVDLGLGYAVPLLADSTWFDGKVSLDIGNIDIPLDEPIKTVGDAVITLHTVRSGPSSPAIVSILDLIAKLRGREPQHELVFVDGSKIAIGIKDSAVTHSGLQFGLPRVDPRLQLESSGSVGLADKRLALVLEIPIPVEQLARRDDVKALGVPKLSVPIGGTLDDPVVEWDVLRGDSANLIAMIRSRVADEAPAKAAALGALEGLASGQADQAIAAAADLFKEIRERRRASKEAVKEAPDVQPTDTPPGETKRPIRDALRGLRRGKIDSP